MCIVIFQLNKKHSRPGFEAGSVGVTCQFSVNPGEFADISQPGSLVDIAPDVMNNKLLWMRKFRQICVEEHNWQKIKKLR